MSGVNKVIILGRLGKDPELSYTQGGMAVCKFSLATSKRKKDGTDVTQWHNITAFGKTAEVITQYTARGQELYIEGELSYSQYEKDGIVRYKTDIFVTSFNFVGSKPNNQGQSGQQPEQRTQSFQQTQQTQQFNQKTYEQYQSMGSGNDEDSIPF